MITQFPNPSASPMIEKLRQALEESGGGFEWLLIAHSDDRLVHSLYAALSHLPVCILQAPQESWEFQHGELAEAIEWAIHHTSLKHLALVGHSHALVGDAPETSPMSLSEDTSRSYQRLRDGVARTKANTRDSQARFSEQLEQLVSGPVVRQQLLDGDLSVYGLFFIAESAAFLAYDPDRKTFLPLIP